MKKSECYNHRDQKPSINNTQSIAAGWSNDTGRRVTTLSWQVWGTRSMGWLVPLPNIETTLRRCKLTGHNPLTEVSELWNRRIEWMRVIVNLNGPFSRSLTKYIFKLNLFHLSLWIIEQNLLITSTLGSQANTVFVSFLIRFCFLCASVYPWHLCYHNNDISYCNPEFGDSSPMSGEWF